MTIEQTRKRVIEICEDLGISYNEKILIDLMLLYTIATRDQLAETIGGV